MDSQSPSVVLPVAQVNAVLEVVEIAELLYLARHGIAVIAVMDRVEIQEQ
jgi:hypothetical protein